MGRLDERSVVGGATASRVSRRAARRSRRRRGRSSTGYIMRVASPYAECRVLLPKPASEMTVAERRSVMRTAHRRLWRPTAAGTLVPRFGRGSASTLAPHNASRRGGRRRRRSSTPRRARRGGRDPADPGTSEGPSPDVAGLRRFGAQRGAGGTATKPVLVDERAERAVIRAMDVSARARISWRPAGQWSDDGEAVVSS